MDNPYQSPQQMPLAAMGIDSEIVSAEYATVIRSTRRWILFLTIGWGLLALLATGQNLFQAISRFLAFGNAYYVGRIIGAVLTGVLLFWPIVNMIRFVAVSSCFLEAPTSELLKTTLRRQLSVWRSMGFVFLAFLGLVAVAIMLSPRGF